jgi:hypothetical protein
MSRLVLDACVALKTVLIEPASDVAHALIEDFSNQIHELIVPDILPVEVGHALTRAERQGVIEPALTAGDPFRGAVRGGKCHPFSWGSRMEAIATHYVESDWCAKTRSGARGVPVANGARGSLFE